MWRSSALANGTRPRGHLRSASSVSVRDRDDTYAAVVRQLVTDVTRDLRPTWVKQ